MGKTTHVDVEVEPNTTITQPLALLEKTMEEYNISFEQIKERAVQKQMEGAENWSTIKDISPLSMFTIISGIKNKNKK
jgi:acetyl-CoA acetyltransferase